MPQRVIFNARVPPQIPDLAFTHDNWAQFR